MKNDVVLINLIILGGLGKFCNVSMSETVSGRFWHSDGENLSVISTGSPLFQVKCLGCVSYRTCAKLQLIYGLKMSKTATLDTFTV